MDWSWMVLCLCACVGALSLCSWLRIYVVELIKGMMDFIRTSVKTVIRVKKMYVCLQVEMVDQQAQATYTGSTTTTWPTTRVN